jgi:hypothetical protein
LTYRPSDSIIDTTEGFYFNTPRKANMKNFVIGTIFGLILATVGFSGIARMLDKSVDALKTQSQELAK